jgi:hypothetical protein
MHHRLLTPLGVPIVLLGLFSWAVAPIAGQAVRSVSNAQPSKWTPASRTPDGQPDLQGLWNYQTATPLERPKEFADKAFLTEAEARRVEAEAAARNDDQLLTGGSQGDPGTYNNFWNDPGLRVVPSRRSSLILDPANGRMPPLTPEAQKKRAAAVAYEKAHPADTWIDRGPNERCVARPFPRLSSSYKNGIQILQVPGYVVLHHEYFHDTRIIPLDGRPPLDKSIRQWNGDSRGRWEGNTLVIETTNFSDEQEVLVRGTPGIDQGNLRLIERLTRVAPDVINYQVTFEDPTTWTQPWTLESPWRPDTSLHYEDACHEGNHSIVGILSGTRADEKNATSTKGSP